MISIEKKARLFRWLHDSFRKLYPVIARKLKFQRWEGDVWHWLATPVLEKKLILLTDDKQKMWARCNHLTDLTAVFGRTQEYEIGFYIRKLPRGGIFIDAGAHTGRYTLKAAEAVGPSGRVIAFEPDYDNFLLLCDNCNLNDYYWVEAEQYALGAENGMITLFSGKDAATNTILSDWYNILHPTDDIDCATRTDVPIRRLGEVLEKKEISHVDLMKIDVEGAEMQLLQGVRNWLAQHRIRGIICEVHSPVVTINEVVQFLKQHGYKTAEIGASEIYGYIRNSQLEKGS